MKLVLNLKELFFAIFSYKHGLSLLNSVELTGQLG